MAMLNKIPKKRVPALSTVHSRNCYWEQFQEEEAAFTSWMTEPINEERDHVAFKDGQSGNLRKIRAGVANIVAFMACEVEPSWGSSVSYQWLLCESQAEFKAMYRGYSEYLDQERSADPGYIAKTLKDFQWPIYWAGLQADPQVDTEELCRKVCRLGNQYESRAYRAKQRQELGALEPDSTLSLTEVRAQLEELELQLMEELGPLTSEVMTSQDRCKVAETLALKAMVRGGRTVDLARLRLGVSDDIAVSRAWLDSVDLEPEDAVLWLEDGSWTIAVLNSKKHWLHFPCADLSLLLELYARCFPELDLGDLIFTPAMHGTRATQSHSPHMFDTADKFGNFIQSTSQKLLGVSLRPYGMRRLNASRLQQNNCSAEVKQSFSALMGTGVRNLEGCYDQRTQRDKSYLAAEVQRHQDNLAFDPAQQNKILAVSKPPDVLMAAVVARLIRTEAGGNKLLALYEHASEFMELSEQFVMLPSSEFEHAPAGLLALEPVTGRQIWRNKSAAALVATQRPLELLSVLPNPAPKDMVYITDTCSLAEVLEHSADEYTVLVAQQQDHGRSVTQAAFRFTDASKTQSVTRDQLTFPVDLRFDSAKGIFYVHRSKTLTTV